MNTDRWGLAGSEQGQVGLALKGHTVERSDGIKYLGIIIDSKLQVDLYTLLAQRWRLKFLYTSLTESLLTLSLLSWFGSQSVRIKEAEWRRTVCIPVSRSWAASTPSSAPTLVPRAE